jgi:tRNA U34 5-carboxymethylaminomethyl modifying GTPase MnmE/TrmE
MPQSKGDTMRTTLHSFLLLTTAVTFCALPVLAQQHVAPAPAKHNKPESMMSPQEKELKRISGIIDWMRKTHPTHHAYVEKLYEPVLVGCRKDYPRNLKMAEFYNDKAAQAERANQAKNTENYTKAAQYYQALAEQNAKIVKAFADNKGETLDVAVDEMRKLEEWIQQVTGKAVERDWFLPGEVDGAGSTTPAPAAGAKPKVTPGTVR